MPVRTREQCRAACMLTSLPPEIITTVCQYLTIGDIDSLSRACRTFRPYATNAKILRDVDLSACVYQASVYQYLITRGRHPHAPFALFIQQLYISTGGGTRDFVSNLTSGIHCMTSYNEDARTHMFRLLYALLRSSVSGVGRHKLRALALPLIPPTIRSVYETDGAMPILTDPNHHCPYNPLVPTQWIIVSEWLMEVCLGGDVAFGHQFERWVWSLCLFLHARNRAAGRYHFQGLVIMAYVLLNRLMYAGQGTTDLPFMVSEVCLLTDNAYTRAQAGWYLYHIMAAFPRHGLSPIPVGLTSRQKYKIVCAIMANPQYLSQAALYDRMIATGNDPMVDFPGNVLALNVIVRSLL
jgi:hypothetical protein